MKRILLVLAAFFAGGAVSAAAFEKSVTGVAPAANLTPAGFAEADCPVSGYVRLSPVAVK